MQVAAAVLLALLAGTAWADEAKVADEAETGTGQLVTFDPDTMLKVEQDGPTFTISDEVRKSLANGDCLRIDEKGAMQKTECATDEQPCRGDLDTVAKALVNLAAQINNTNAAQEPRKGE